jgi:hypothetical protein
MAREGKEQHAVVLGPCIDYGTVAVCDWGIAVCIASPVEIDACCSALGTSKQEVDHPKGGRKGIADADRTPVEV